MFSKNLSGPFAHERNTQSVQNPASGCERERVDVLDDLRSRLLTHALEFEELVHCKPVEIRDIVNQATAEELIYQRISHTVDVHHST